MKPSIEKLSTMFTKLNKEANAVPFSDVDYYANQIEIIFEVSEVEAYELAQQLKEKNMKKLQITGFTYVTTTGIARMYQALDSYGTVGILYELDSDEMVSMLMDTKHFNNEAYITEHTHFTVDMPQFDDMLIEIHDELVDAYTMVLWGYSHMLNEVSINSRTITNFGSAVDMTIDTWEPKTVTIEELEAHCANTTHIEPVYVRLIAHADGQSYQRFEWTIGEAEEFHAFAAMYEAIKAVYANINIQLV